MKKGDISQLMKSYGKAGGLARAKKMTKAARLASSRKANEALAKKRAALKSSKTTAPNP